MEIKNIEQNNLTNRSKINVLCIYSDLSGVG